MKANGWWALCVRAAGWLTIGPEAQRLYPEQEFPCERFTPEQIAVLAFFARLMALVTGETHEVDPWTAKACPKCGGAIIDVFSVSRGERGAMRLCDRDGHGCGWQIRRVDIIKTDDAPAEAFTAASLAGEAEPDSGAAIGIECMSCDALATSEAVARAAGWRFGTFADGKPAWICGACSAQGEEQPEGFPNPGAGFCRGLGPPLPSSALIAEARGLASPPRLSHRMLDVFDRDAKAAVERGTPLTIELSPSQVSLFVGEVRHGRKLAALFPALAERLAQAESLRAGSSGARTAAQLERMARTVDQVSYRAEVDQLKAEIDALRAAHAREREGMLGDVAEARKERDAAREEVERRNARDAAPLAVITHAELKRLASRSPDDALGDAPDDVRELVREVAKRLTEARAEIKRMKPVFEAAEHWVQWGELDGFGPAEKLRAAVHAAQKGTPS